MISKRCLDCGKHPGFCLHPSFDSILGQIGQSGRYLWVKDIEIPKALEVLVRSKALIYQGVMNGLFHVYVIHPGLILDDLYAYCKAFRFDSEMEPPRCNPIRST